MKQLFSLATLVVLLSSCHIYTPIKVAAGHDPSEPGKGNFIHMKDGKEIKLSDNVEIKTGEPDIDALRKITVNNEKINTKNVESFQVNGDFYQAFQKRNFARRIYRGSLNIYTHVSTSTTTSTNSAGMMSTHTSSTKQYFIQKEKVNNNELYQVRYMGKQNMLAKYLEDYKPSLEIYNTYREKRHINRIVHLATAGLWLASIPMMLSKNENVKLIGAANVFLGFIYTPVVAVTVGARNRKRPFEAVQQYIDNKVLDYDKATDQKVAVEKVPEVAPAAATTNKPMAVDISDEKRDFLVVNNEKIVAADGTKLRSANNKRFVLNDKQYTSGVTAYQINRKYYIQFPGMDPDEFAQRSIAGKISVFNIVDNNGSQAKSNISGHQFIFNPRARKNTYFVKDGREIKGFSKLGPFFEDNPRAYAEYNNYLRQSRNTAIASYTMTAVSLGLVGVAIAQVHNTGSNMALPLVLAGSGISIVNYYLTLNKAKKLSKQLLHSIKLYNGVVSR